MNSLNNVFSSRMIVGAAIVGIVGAAGVFIYEQMYAEKRRAMLVREVARLDNQIASMRTELESLRELQKETHLRRVKQKKSGRPRPERAPKKSAPSGDVVDAPEQSYASDSEYYTDYQSIGGTDAEMDSEEFYDVHTDDDDEDDDTLRASIRNGLMANLEEDPSDKNDSPKLSIRNAT
ncbi:uncharacterized protein LOC101742653 [Bombyx mori]|uniref:Uncharacterized protein n=1 Tax=Bombyx mori TaxID=7091 RepID=A0A8R2AK02_BOMMO|nr:uncharacterized protein LOC101742653 [Bombyx mori]